MRPRTYQTASEPSRDSRRSARFWASIAVVDDGIARTFSSQAQAGRAAFPESSIEIVYDLDGSYDGFIPRSDFSDDRCDKMPGQGPAWRRRYLPRARCVNGVPLDEAHLADVVAGELPRFSQIDYESLNLEDELDRIGALDLLYPSHVRTEFRADPASVRYRVDDPMSWLARLGEQNLGRVLSARSTRGRKIVCSSADRCAAYGPSPRRALFAERRWHRARRIRRYVCAKRPDPKQRRTTGYSCHGGRLDSFHSRRATPFK